MSLFNVQTPFFRPLWRRVAVVAVTLGWTVVELSQGELFWAILFGAAGLYCAHQFFIAFDPKDPQKKDDL